MTFSGVKFTLLLLLFFVLFFSFWFQEEDNYLSYESFPVLCPDAASTLHRHPRSMFANRLLTAAVNVTTPSTSALAWPGSTLIVRVSWRSVQTRVRLYWPKNRTRNYPASFQHYPLLINPPRNPNIGIQGYNQAQCECDHLNFSFFVYIIISNNCPYTRAVVLKVDRNF